MSVLIAVHNADHLVGAAIESIAGQTYRDWELIIVNDGSTDDTSKVLQAWETNERVTVIEHSVRLGLSVSMNHAFARARGELIARLDADDVSLPARLESQVAFLDAHPEVAVLGTGAELVDADGTPLRTVVLLEHHEEIAAHIYRRSPLIHPSVVFRRTFLEALGGYDPRLRRAQDADLWLRGYRRFRYHNLQEPLIRYRVGSRLSTQTILYGSFALVRGAYREDRMLAGCLYALRFLVSGSLTKVGLRRRRLP